MTVIILTSGTSWTVPGDWTNTNQVETWGSGGAGGTASTARVGGGGGSCGYSSISNLTGLSGSITIQIGAAGAHNGSQGHGGGSGNPTWFNGATQAASSVSSNGGGGGGSNVAGTGSGAGTAASTTGATGTTKTAGAAGGTNGSADSGGGGGGASGAAGVGAAGGAGATNGGAGGQGDNGSGGAGGSGGTSGSVNGADGTANTEGGGGGGGGYGASGQATGGTGGAGALPGGGGGGGALGTSTGGLGGDGGGGQIRITYTPVASGITPFWNDSQDPILEVWQRIYKLRLDYSGWQQSPLAASGPPTLSLGYTWEVPYNTRATQWLKHSFQGQQWPPLSGAFVNASPPLPVYDLPQRVKPPLHQDWQQHPLSADSLPEIREQPYDVPLGKKWIKYDFNGWQQSPLSAAGPLPLGESQYDVPAGRWNAARYQYWTDQPRPGDVVQPPIQPYYELPQRVWKTNKVDYSGWTQPPLSDNQPIARGSWSYDVPPQGRWNISRYQYWSQGVIPVEYVVPPPSFDLPVRTWTTNRQDYEGYAWWPQGKPPEPLDPFTMNTDLPQPNRLWRYMNAIQGYTAAPLSPMFVPPPPRIYLPLMGVGAYGP